LNATEAVMIVEAAPGELRPGRPNRTPIYKRMQAGVFVVSGSSNRVQLSGAAMATMLLLD